MAIPCLGTMKILINHKARGKKEILILIDSSHFNQSINIYTRISSITANF